jgi:hypothetical protein
MCVVAQFKNTKQILNAGQTVKTSAQQDHFSANSRWVKNQGQHQ